MQEENEYITKDSKVGLSDSAVFLKVGETAEISIASEKLEQSVMTVSNMWVVFAPEINPEEMLQDDMWANYGVDYIYAMDGACAVTVTASEETVFEEYVAVANALSREENVEEVYLQKESKYQPESALSGEDWSLTDESVAELALSGGEYVEDEVSLEGWTREEEEKLGLQGTYLSYMSGQTALVTGKIPGTTTLHLRKGFLHAQAEADCVITVYLAGDADQDGRITAGDALAALRHTVHLQELQGISKTAADVDGDEAVTADDALQILRYIVRLVDVL